MLLVAAGLVLWLLLRPRPDVGQASAPPAADEHPLAYYLARADPVRGETYFMRCAACHTIAPGDAASIGPNLHGVMGAPMGGRPGFAYSAALRGHGGSWDWEAANSFLRDPRAFAPGNRMTFAGVRNPQDRADVMLYLNREGGTLTLPVAGR
jgi:cytochrome c